MKILIPLLLLAFAGNVSAAEVYKCVSDYGKVTYQSSPCDKGKQEKMKIKSEPTDPAAVVQRMKSETDKAEAIDKATAEADKKAADDKQKADQKAKACESAKMRVAQLNEARRVSTGAGESRKYLDDSELAAEKQKAQDAVSKACGN